MNLQLMPNPAATYFTIKLQAAKESNASIKITDMYGRIVMVQKKVVVAGTNMITINNLSFLAAGNYNVQVQLEDQILSNKIVVIR